MWPFIDSFQEYVALAVAMEVDGTLGGSAHGAYIIDVLPPSERVESRAYMYSALNVGFSWARSSALVHRLRHRVLAAVAVRC